MKDVIAGTITVVIMLGLLYLLFWTWGLSVAKGDTLPAGVIVVDGDTFKVDKQYYRILGYDAPELHRFQCQKERDLAAIAKTELEKILADPNTKIQTTGKFDLYHRLLTNVELNGKQVADIMIEKKLGHFYKPGVKRGGWCE